MTEQMREQRIEELETICAEAYQVLGAFIDDLPDHKILDNLAEVRLVHKDVLPFTRKQAALASLPRISEEELHEQILECFALPVLMVSEAENIIDNIMATLRARFPQLGKEGV